METSNSKAKDYALGNIFAPKYFHVVTTTMFDDNGKVYFQS